MIFCNFCDFHAHSFAVRPQFPQSGILGLPASVSQSVRDNHSHRLYITVSYNFASGILNWLPQGNVLCSARDYNIVVAWYDESEMLMRRSEETADAIHICLSLNFEKPIICTTVSHLYANRGTIFCNLYVA